MIHNLIKLRNIYGGIDFNTYFGLCYLRMIVHNKPRDRLITSGSCKRSLVFVKPVSNIRGNEQWR